MACEGRALTSRVSTDRDDFGTALLEFDVQLGGDSGRAVPRWRRRSLRSHRRPRRGARRAGARLCLRGLPCRPGDDRRCLWHHRPGHSVRFEGCVWRPTPSSTEIPAALAVSLPDRSVEVRDARWEGEAATMVIVRSGDVVLGSVPRARSCVGGPGRGRRVLLTSGVDVTLRAAGEPLGKMLLRGGTSCSSVVLSTRPLPRDERSQCWNVGFQGVLHLVPSQSSASSVEWNPGGVFTSTLNVQASGAFHSRRPIGVGAHLRVDIAGSARRVGSGGCVECLRRVVGTSQRAMPDDARGSCGGALTERRALDARGRRSRGQRSATSSSMWAIR